MSEQQFKMIDEFPESQQQLNESAEALLLLVTAKGLLSDDSADRIANTLRGGTDINVCVADMLDRLSKHDGTSGLFTDNDLAVLEETSGLDVEQRTHDLAGVMVRLVQAAGRS